MMREHWNSNFEVIGLRANAADPESGETGNCRCVRVSRSHIFESKNYEQSKINKTVTSMHDHHHLLFIIVITIFSFYFY